MKRLSLVVLLVALATGVLGQVSLKSTAPGGGGGGPITYVQTCATPISGSDSANCTLNGVVANNTILVSALSFFKTDTESVTAGSVSCVRRNRIGPFSTTQYELSQWECFGLVGGTTQITYSTTGGTSVALAASEFSGLTQTGGFDQTAAQTQLQTTTPSSGNAGTTTQANELLYAGAANSSQAQYYTAGTGYTVPTECGSGSIDKTLGCEYQIVASTGVYSAGFVYGLADHHVILGTYK